MRYMTFIMFLLLKATVTPVDPEEVEVVMEWVVLAAGAWAWPKVAMPQVPIPGRSITSVCFTPKSLQSHRFAITSRLVCLDE